MIIFGAGASFGSDSANTPPIGGKLFENLQKFDPLNWGKLNKNISVIFKSDFELGMQKAIDDIEINSALLHKKLAQYLFEFEISK